MSKTLKKIGLTKDQVIKATGLPAKAINATAVVASKSKYLYGTDQKRMRRRMKTYESFIVARFAEGWHPGTIARILSVSEESVRSRLRKHSVFKNDSVGRPLKSKASLLGILMSDQ